MQAKGADDGRRRGLLAHTEDAYPVPPQFHTPPTLPASRRRAAIMAARPGHLAFLAALAVLLWYYARPTLVQSQVSTTKLDASSGWSCMMLSALNDVDVPVIDLGGLVLALNPQLNVSSTAWMTATAPDTSIRCAADMVLPTRAPGGPYAPLSYTFINGLYGSSTILQADRLPCPALNASGAPRPCLSFNLSGFGQGGSSTTYEYIAPVGIMRNQSGGASQLIYGTVTPPDTASGGTYTPALHLSLQNYIFPTYESCLADLTVACAPTVTIFDLPWDSMDVDTAAGLPWTPGDNFNGLPAKPAGFSGVHRWKLCSLYATAEAAVRADNSSAVGSFYWLDTAFMRVPVANPTGPDDTYYHFTHTQECTADVIADFINDASGGPSAFKQEMCNRVKVLPPYSCTRNVRRPVLEILSLASANALSGLGVYFAITSVLVKHITPKDDGAVEDGADSGKKAAVPEGGESV